MTYIHSFAPIVGKQPAIIILGSMPGIASLEAQQYYAHPRNAFWRIMEALFDIPYALPYQQRLQQLKSCRIAIWDVLKTCTRATSLDSDIVGTSIVTNDFLSLFESHPSITKVFFNGATAEKTYLKHVHADVAKIFPAIQLQRLPSTSPAHASLNLAQKIAAWSCVREMHTQGQP